MQIKVPALAFSIAGALAIAHPALAQTMPIIAGGDSMMVSVPNDMLTVDAVNADADGYIVVHKVDGGKPGAVIGHATVKKGENKNIEVKLDDKVESGAKLALMLHADSGKMGTYEFGMDGSNEDAPMMMDSKPVVEIVTVK